MKALAPHWGALLALALFLAAGLAVLDDYGITADELHNVLRAERNYAFLIGEDDDFASAEFYVRLYGPAFDMALLFVERAFGLEDSSPTERCSRASARRGRRCRGTPSRPFARGSTTGMGRYGARSSRSGGRG